MIEEEALLEYASYAATCLHHEPLRAQDQQRDRSRPPYQRENGRGPHHPRPQRTTSKIK